MKRAEVKRKNILIFNPRTAPAILKNEKASLEPAARLGTHPERTLLSFNLIYILLYKQKNRWASIL
jgi:hypothetical protein